MDEQKRGGGRNTVQNAKRRCSDDSQPSTSKRQASDDQSKKRSSKRIIDFVETRPKNCVKKVVPKPEQKIRLQANYFQLEFASKKELLKYHVTFEPEVDLPRVRNALINTQKPIFGGYLFDGAQLYLVRRLKDDQLDLVTQNRDGIDHHIRLRYTIDIEGDEIIAGWNLIMRRAMQGLDMKLVQRNFYDPGAAISLPRHHIQLWPGYDTSVRQHEYNILLNVDFRTKIMRTDTVYDMMAEVRHSRDFRGDFQRKVLGITVLTDYNNTTYRIDDVEFEKTPRATFLKNGSEISFIQYYQQKYNKTIMDPDQPLLISRAKQRAIRGGADELILLIPELCRLTGLREDQRNNIALKNDLRGAMCANPPQRLHRLLEFNRRLRSNERSQETFEEWELQLDDKLVSFDGHIISPQTIQFGDGLMFSEKRPSWDHRLKNFKMFDTVILDRFYFLFSRRLERESNHFLITLEKLARAMGFDIRKPRQKSFDDDKDMGKCLVNAANDNPKMILCIIDNNRANSYNMIKKKLCFDHAVLSQVVTRRTVTSTRNFESIVSKIAIQMCTKLGGAPWLPHIPQQVDGLMTVGFDVSVDTADKQKTYGALVATMDLGQSDDNGRRVNRSVKGVRFFSAVSENRNSDTLSTDFALNMAKAVRAFNEAQGTLPKKIIIYRGGVGDGQIRYVRDVEVQSIENQLKQMYAGKNLTPELLFIIVNKRHNTRLFTSNGKNPPAGTVVDDVITQPERYDFYLVPQETTQGTATPTLYNVIHDTTTEFDARRVQMWTYKMCHMYYNWSGTTRVPAVMQYATKLSFLVANSIHRLPSTDLDRKLYFL